MTKNIDIKLNEYVTYLLFIFMSLYNLIRKLLCLNYIFFYL